MRIKRATVAAAHEAFVSMLGGAAAGAVASSAVVRATEPHFLRVHCLSGRAEPNDSGSRRRRNMRPTVKASDAVA
jgi:hypothetical protein